MTPQEVTDVVAWLVARRKPNPGQPMSIITKEPTMSDLVQKQNLPKRCRAARC